MRATPTVGFVGAGKIGEPMVERLAAAGYPVSVFARRPEVVDRIRALGATVVTEPAALAPNEVVISCLFDDEQLRSIAPSVLAGMADGSAFVSHTTGSPATILDLARSAEPAGVAVVDAPFSGTPHAVRAGELTVALAGDASALGTVRDVVASYASRVFTMGRTGSALTAKLINNALFTVCTQATLSALEIASDLEVDPTELLTFLQASSGGSTAARYLVDSGEEVGAYADRVQRYLVKDLQAIRSAADDLGIDVSRLVESARLGPIDLRADTVTT